MKLMALDGNSIVNRAFYGVSQNLTTRSGQPTNAVLGFLNILNKQLEDSKPDALCVTFDRKAPTFRHLAYEGYKAQRKGMPEELASQMPILSWTAGRRTTCWAPSPPRTPPPDGTRRSLPETRIPCSSSPSIPPFAWCPPAWDRPPPRR